jgi:uncharacterized protein (TIGR02271 family)
MTERSQYTGREITGETDVQDVYTADGEKLGKTTEVAPDLIVVEGGGLFSKSHYWVPESAIESEDEQGIHLSFTKDQIQDQGWDHEPTDRAEMGASAGSGSSGSSDYETGSGSMSGIGSETGSERDDATIRLHEEQLNAGAVSHDAGEARISKETIEEVQRVDVPVTREELRVERRPATTDQGDESAFTGDEIRVPLREETVEVSKSSRPVEEVNISKVGVQDTQTVEDTVRREELNVDDAGSRR